MSALQALNAHVAQARRNMSAQAAGRHRSSGVGHRLPPRVSDVKARAMAFGAPWGWGEKDNKESRFELPEKNEDDDAASPFKSLLSSARESEEGEVADVSATSSALAQASEYSCGARYDSRTGSHDLKANPRDLGIA